MPSYTDRKYRYMQSEQNLDYSKGFDSYLANDVIPANVLTYATDTRISTLGRQKTRQACDFYSVPAGETINAVQTSVTGASNQNIGVTSWLAAKFTTSAAGRLTRVDLNVKNVASATGPLIVEIRADSGGSPGALLAQSSVPASTPTGAYAYLTARFIEAPLLANGSSYWIVVHIQAGGTNTYAWSSTTNASTAKTSSNSGISWSASAFDLNFKTYLSTDGGVLGHYRAYKSDGTKVTLIAYREAAGTTAVAKINDGTGALTNIKTGLSASATRYEFETFNDVVYYVNGYDAPRKWDFTTEAACGGSPAVASDIMVHKTRVFFVTANSTKVFFSNIADAETFTSTDFVYIPAPKSPDPITKPFILNDVLWFLTTRTKWGLYGSDISNMVLRKSTGVKGSTAPDSVQVTRSAAYFASDDNVYRFNGATDTPIFEAITGDYQRNTANKTSFGSAIFNNRYYLFAAPAGAAQNSQCWVYNIDFNSMESLDLATYIQKTRVWNGAVDSGQFVQASNLVGALYYGESASNGYNNLGRALSWELRTKYDHMGNPGTNKHVKRWYPRFAAAGNYSVTCQYDKDFAVSPTSLFVNLLGSGKVYGSGALYGTGLIYGSSALIAPKITIPGLAHYVQRRYLCSGVNQPVEFLGDTLYYFLRRPR